MANRNYVKGRAFEHAVRKWYEQKGYTVIRSAGSKGKIDLFAWQFIINTGKSEFKTDAILVPDVRVIQCKLYGKKTTKPLRTDLELLKQVSVPNSWQRVLAWRVHGESEFKEEVV